MDAFLKFIGLDRRKDEPKTHSDYTKRMDEWLEKNVPKYEPKVSLRKKLWDLTWISTFAVGTLYLYMVDIQKFPRKRDIRRYRLFTGAVMVCKYPAEEIR